MTFRRLAAAALGVLLVGASLAAQTPETVTPRREKRAEQRAKNQQKRIVEGVASGQLTPRETVRLERQEGRVNRDIAKAEADGKITKKEAGKIQREQNRESRRIARQKHDAQTRK